MGGSISKCFAGGEGSVKAPKNKVRGLRNRRRAFWAKEKFVKDLMAKKMAERMEARNQRFEDEEDYGYGYDPNR
jgi:hypothetical protein